MTEQEPLEDFKAEWKEPHLVTWQYVSLWALFGGFACSLGSCGIAESMYGNIFNIPWNTFLIATPTIGFLAWLWYKKTWPRQHSIIFKGNGDCIITTHNGKQRCYQWADFRELKVDDCNQNIQSLEIIFYTSTGHTVTIPGEYRQGLSLVVLKFINEAWEEAKAQAVKENVKSDYQL